MAQLYYWIVFCDKLGISSSFFLTWDTDSFIAITSYSNWLSSWLVWKSVYSSLLLFRISGYSPKELNLFFPSKLWIRLCVGNLPLDGMQKVG